MLNLTKNIKICLGLLSVGFLIHLIAVAIPFWNFLAENNESETKSYRLINLGLWQACFKHGDKYWCQEYTALKGFIATKCFEVLCLVGYVTSIVLLIIYEIFPVYGTRILIACLTAMCVTVVSAVCGILCWIVGSGTSMQYNLSWSFGLSMISLIFPVVSSIFLLKERSIHTPKERENSISY